VKVTVLLAVHDGERFLGSAIESVLGQTFGDFELLVVDDASTDATPQILATVGDARLRVLRNEENIGQVASLNRGLREARGDYIARLDADDSCRTDRLDLQVTVRPPDPESLFLAPRDDSLTTAQATRLVRAARARQRARGWLNARIPSQALDEVSPLAKGPRDLLVRAARASTLSARGIIKVKRIARTVADLEGHEQVTSEDMAEALLLRHRDEPVVMAAREEKPAKQVRASS